MAASLSMAYTATRASPEYSFAGAHTNVGHRRQGEELPGAFIGKREEK